MAALRETIPLQKRKIFKKSLSVFILVPVCASLVLLIPSVFGLCPKNPIVLILGALLSIACFFIIPLYQYFYFKRYFYDIDENNIVIRKGVITQKEITLPFSRITDVYVDQDFFDVLFGIYDVHISTPTQESGLFAHIDGIDKKGSEQLKKMILDKINKTNT